MNQQVATDAWMVSNAKGQAALDLQDCPSAALAMVSGGLQREPLHRDGSAGLDAVGLVWASVHSAGANVDRVQSVPWCGA